MKGSEKDEILAKAKAFFQANIMESHRRNTAKLVSNDRRHAETFFPDVTSSKELCQK